MFKKRQRQLQSKNNEDNPSSRPGLNQLSHNELEGVIGGAISLDANGVYHDDGDTDWNKDGVIASDIRDDYFAGQVEKYNVMFSDINAYNEKLFNASGGKIIQSSDDPVIQSILKRQYEWENDNQR